MSGAALFFENVTVRYGAVLAVDNVTATIEPGSLTALVGASGSGKSTLLKTVNRLTAPDEGRVLLDGVDVAARDAHMLRRSVGYVFQGIGLFPHMTVGQNIALGPRLSGSPLSESKIADLLEGVALLPDLATRLPDALSGGQRQRVGVARALAIEPDLLLMDEPFGALDPITRDALGREVRDLQQQRGLTTVMVTHDMAEALLLADRVLVMEAGGIVADETPKALLNGAGGDIAQALVAVPREQAERLAAR